MVDRLRGKIALVTGGAGGCGRAASELFAAEGARVGIVDLPSSAGLSHQATLSALVV